jgi:hypothetical protein
VVSEERTTSLIKSCLKPEVLKHPGGMTTWIANAGHFIPNAGNYRTDIVKFVKKHLPAEENGDARDS